MIHQDQPLSENDLGLEGRVRRFWRSFDVLASGYRPLHGNSAESLLSALLVEIDETILPRRIKILTSSNRVAYLIVTNRRLLNITMPGSQTNIETAMPTSPATLVGQLFGLFVDAEKAAVHSKRIDDGSCQSESGYAVPALIAATSMNLTSSDKRDPVETFSNALAGYTIAMATLDCSGQLQSLDGDLAWGRRLENLARSGLADIDAQLLQSLTTPEQPGCIFLSTGGEDGFVLIYARAKSAGFLAILPACHLPLVQPAWLTLFD